MDALISVREKLFEEAARTGTGSSRSILSRASLAAQFYTEVTGTTGTSPALTLIYETSPNGEDWYEIGRTADITTIGKVEPQIFSEAAIGEYLRLSYEIIETVAFKSFLVHKQM